MKISLKSQNAGWVIDQIVHDYIKFTRHDVVRLKDNPDVFWCVILFKFPEMIRLIPSECVSVVHIHHIDETKLREYDFANFNKADLCVVCNKKTKNIAKKYIDVPIFTLPYWVLTSSMHPRDDAKVQGLRQELAPNGEVLIGSFVKDGEGNLGNMPKLSKGPDIFVEVIRHLHKKLNIKVVLAGHARRYVIGSLEKDGIPYIYKERYSDICSLYDVLDWYLVTSRCEGGPQSVLESSYRNIKILSTDVGIATDILHPDCICSNIGVFVEKIEACVDQRMYNYNKVINEYMPQNVIPIWDTFFEDVCQNKDSLV